MKLLCTGNPAHTTLASAIAKRYPDANFASRTTGYDLRFWDPDSENFFRNNIKNFDTFINSSFICGGGQLALLEATCEEWSKNNIKGHVINIGSTAEWMGVNEIPNNSVYGSYSIQKRALRDRSLQLNNKNGIFTSHIIAGGLNDGKPENFNNLNLDQLADAVTWILNHSQMIPLLEIQARPRRL